MKKSLCLLLSIIIFLTSISIIQAKTLYTSTKIPYKLNGNVVIEYVNSKEFKVVEGKIENVHFTYLDTKGLSEDYPLPFKYMKVYYDHEGYVKKIVDQDQIDVPKRLIKNGLGNSELNLLSLSLQNNNVINIQNQSETIVDDWQGAILYGDASFEMSSDDDLYGSVHVLKKDDQVYLVHKADTHKNNQNILVYGVKL